VTAGAHGRVPPPGQEERRTRPLPFRGWSSLAAATSASPWNATFVEVRRLRQVTSTPTERDLTPIRSFGHGSDFVRRRTYRQSHFSVAQRNPARGVATVEYAFLLEVALPTGRRHSYVSASLYSAGGPRRIRDAWCKRGRGAAVDRNETAALTTSFPARRPGQDCCWSPNPRKRWPPNGSAGAERNLVGRWSAWARVTTAWRSRPPASSCN